MIRENVVADDETAAHRIKIDNEVGALIDRGPAILARRHRRLPQRLQRSHALDWLIQDEPPSGNVVPLAADHCADRGGAPREPARLIDDHHPITHLYEVPERLHQALAAAVRA